MKDVLKTGRKLPKWGKLIVLLFGIAAAALAGSQFYKLRHFKEVVVSSPEFVYPFTVLECTVMGRTPALA